MQFASLGSGSKGNATLIEVNGTCLLVDNGFSIRETTARLQRLKREPENINAILVTHEHSDHIRGVGPLSRKYSIPVWASRGSSSHVMLGEIPDLNYIDVHQDFAINDIAVQPFPVPHDAREPCQFVFSDGAGYIGLLTDTGSSTAHIEQQLSGCDALILECNHDSRMLADGPYPQTLKERVGGRFGHLSNDQAAVLLQAIDTRRLQYLVAAHLSEQNNTEELAQQALADVMGCNPDDIEITDQTAGLGWRSL